MSKYFHYIITVTMEYVQSVYLKPVVMVKVLFKTRQLQFYGAEENPHLDQLQ